MADQRLRELERDAALGEPGAARLLLRWKLRSHSLNEPARRLVDLLTSEGALWLAGVGTAGFNYPATEALTEVLIEWGLEPWEAREVSWSKDLQLRVVELCLERARREWDPIRAIAVLGRRDRIKFALGIERMPRGTAAEERRQRALYMERLLWARPQLADTDVAVSRWRPPKQPPRVMGWEVLLPQRHRYTPICE